MDSMDWLHCDNDEPLWVRRIHKNRYTGKPFIAHTIENMKDVSLRHDDILLCSYPKSGCHWIWDNVRMLMAGEVKMDNVQKGSMMMEIHEHGHFDDYPSPRILNNHVYFDDQPADLLKGHTKVVLVYRNPKDICTSFYYHHSRIPSYKYKGRFSNYIRRFIEGKVSSNCCFDYWNMWEEGLQKNPNIPFILVRYEDFHKNPISERRRLASFLGKEYDSDFLQKVTEATSIDQARQLKDGVSLKDINGQPIMYRKGKVGDWKDHFTVNESEWFDQITEKEMGKSNFFKFVYSID